MSSVPSSTTIRRRETVPGSGPASIARACLGQLEDDRDRLGHLARPDRQPLYSRPGPKAPEVGPLGVDDDDGDAPVSRLGDEGEGSATVFPSGFSYRQDRGV
jgi:hypothetical protein